MLDKTFKNIQKKSLKERFLLVIGILFFLVYLVLGLVIIFWRAFPLNMAPGYRIAFGVILIVYSFLRFLRFFNSNEE
ncbi:cytochrome c biogenesis protein CcdA [Flavobacterium sp. CG_23.5]|nr:cytochrome c biogenesis protein CcdA [Flavobacterium sp. CG_23.5]